MQEEEEGKIKGRLQLFPQLTVQHVELLLPGDGSTGAYAVQDGERLCAGKCECDLINEWKRNNYFDLMHNFHLHRARPSRRTPLFGLKV
jgi:hypothetical protein